MSRRKLRFVIRKNYARRTSLISPAVDTLLFDDSNPPEPHLPDAANAHGHLEHNPKTHSHAPVPTKTLKLQTALRCICIVPLQLSFPLSSPDLFGCCHVPEIGVVGYANRKEPRTITPIIVLASTCSSSA